MSDIAGMGTTVSDPPLLDDLAATLAVCRKPMDALYAALQAAVRLGVDCAAVCLPDPAIAGRLVVRLSLGMDGASNKILRAAGPGETAAEAAYRECRPMVVGDYAAAGRALTDLEERLGIAASVCLPILAADGATPRGVLLACWRRPVPGAAAFVDPLAGIAGRLGDRLARIGPVPAAAAAAELPESARGWPEGFEGDLQSILDMPDIQALSDRTLVVCRSLTGSEFGFVGYIEPETGFLNAPTLTREIFPGSGIPGKTLVFEKAGGLGGWVIDHRIPLVANDPSAHPASVGTPPGHLPIRKFLGVPCLFQGRLLGMIALANKDADYDSHDLGVVGALAGVYAAAVARVLSERELRGSRDHLSSLYDGAPVAYLALSPEGVVRDINRTGRRFLGLADGVGEGRPIDDFLLEADRRLFGQQFALAREGAVADPIEIDYRRLDGTVLPTLQTLSVNRDERGFVYEIRLTLVDISERRRHEAQLQGALEQTVEAMALTIEKRDPYTAGHQTRAADLAVAIGRELRLDDERLKGLHLASLIHDVGKISVPAEILNSPRLLTAVERTLMQSHCESGYEILRNIRFPWPIAEIVRQHHERLDGSGYPAGLRGDAVLLEARILGVADVVEAMMSHRPYRAALGVEATLAEITRGRGEAYDAAVVDACVAVVRRHELEWLV